MSKAIEAVNINNRIYVLQTALLIEKLTTIFLATLLDAKEYINGKSFNGSSALSFNQKINLLIDLGALQDDERAKFQKFMEIRNQFMHDLEADTYQNCISRIKGASNYLYKNYDLKKYKIGEEAIKEGVKLLSIDVYNSTMKIAKTTMDKNIEKLKGEYGVKAMEAFKESIEETVPIIESWAKRVNEGTEPNVPEIIGKAIAAGIYQRVADKMRAFFQIRKKGSD